MQTNPIHFEQDHSSYYCAKTWYMRSRLDAKMTPIFCDKGHQSGMIPGCTASDETCRDSFSLNLQEMMIAEVIETTGNVQIQSGSHSTRSVKSEQMHTHQGTVKHL